jgi:hypothetical protein
MRAQDLVRRSAYPLPAGKVTRLEWFPAATGVARFDQFEIYLCETDSDELTGYFDANYGGATPTLVYHCASQPIAAAKNVYWGVDFETPFEYTAQENLLVELRWADDDGGFIYTYAGAEPVYAFVSQHDNTAVFGGTKLMQHRFRLTVAGVEVEPSSYGRVKAIFR